MKKILIGLLILGLIGVTLYGLFRFSNKNRESEVKEHYLPVVVGEEIKLYDIKSNSLSSIPGNPEAEVVFGESVDGKWLIISEGKREVVYGPTPIFFSSGWNLYRVNKETGEKLPIVLDKNVIVAVRSPKEDLIAYVTHKHGLWLVNLDGENKRQVVPDNIVMEFNILYGISTPMIHWSPDGERIGFSTFPEDWDGSDMWMHNGVGFYLLDEDKFIHLTARDLLKTIGFYSVEDKSFKDYSYLKGNPDDPKDRDDCLSSYRCHGWLDKDTSFIGIGQGSSICGLTEWNGIITYNILTSKRELFFGSDIIPGAYNEDMMIYEDFVYFLNSLISDEEYYKATNYLDLFLIKLSKEGEILDQKILVKDLNSGFWAKFTPDGKIIYENNDGRPIIINIDGSNSVVLPPEIKLPIYLAP